MSLRISGPGETLPVGTNWLVNNVNYSVTNNLFTLNSGQSVVIPPGDWLVRHDGYSLLQRYDPISTLWTGFSSTLVGPQYIRSDGQSHRVANLTSCAVSAVVTNAGSGYTSTPTVTPSTGTSEWTAILGGSIATSVTVDTAGSGYTLPPILLIDAPPPGGLQATAYATISGGAVNAVVVTNVGAGYTSIPDIQVIPSPFDPNIDSITTAAVSGTISGSADNLAAVVCTNNGGVLASIPTLTVAGGGGASGAATVVMLYTITSIAASGGSLYNQDEAVVVTAGGRTSATVASGYLNPYHNLTTFLPRMLTGTVTITANAVAGVTIYDGGLYTSSSLSTNLPVVNVLAQTHTTNEPTGTLTLTPTLGGNQSTVYLQQL